MSENPQRTVFRVGDRRIMVTTESNATIPVRVDEVAVRPSVHSPAFWRRSDSAQEKHNALML